MPHSIYLNFRLCSVHPKMHSVLQNLGVLAFINCCKVHWVAKLQNLFMAAKVLALGLVITTGCVVYFIQGESRGLKNPFANTSTDPSKIALSFYSAIFSYAGWYVCKFMGNLNLK